MSDEHREAHDRVGDRIVETFVPGMDPVERAKLIGAVELGQRIGELLQCELADEGTWVDTGSDGHSYDCHVTIKGREYHVNVSPGSTEAEMDQWEAELKQEASQWDLLCPRVTAALRAGPDAALADEFEAYVTPRDSGSQPQAENGEAG